jgi:ribonucleoside-diphosphate reductase alpha chain
MDYIFRRLALDFLPYERRAELGIFTAKERAAQLRAEAEAEAAAVDLTALASSAPIETKPGPAGGESASADKSGAGPLAEAADTAGANDAPGAKGAPGAATADVAASRPAPRVGSSTELLEAVSGKAADAPLCFTCGTKMRPAGSCYVCEGCGSTSGCS